MSISSSYSPTKVSGDGVTADVSFMFKVFSTSDIKLSLIDKTTDEVLDVLTLGVDYTVTINPVSEGGEVTFLDPTDHDSTMWIFIESVIPYTQPTSFTIDGKLSEKRVEDALDRLLRLIQQVGRATGLAVQFPSNFTGTVPTMPLAEDGKVLGWNASDELVNYELDPGTALAKASQAEAEAGAENTPYMTPLRTAQAIAALAPSPTIASQAEAEAGSNNTKFMTPLRVSQAIAALESADSFGTQLLHVRDEKAAGTDGGGFTSGAWQTRVLNTVKTNEIASASLSSNQVSLPAGTYYFHGRAAAYLVNSTKIMLKSISGTATEIIGDSGYRDSVSAGYAYDEVSGRFTLLATTVLELQHRCSTTKNTNGLGYAANLDGKVEVFAELKIWKVA